MAKEDLMSLNFKSGADSMKDLRKLLLHLLNQNMWCIISCYNFYLDIFPIGLVVMELRWENFELSISNEPILSN